LTLEEQPLDEKRAREIVIRKDDYALVYFCATAHKKQRGADAWKLTSRWEEKFSKALVGNTYQRILCSYYYACDGNNDNVHRYYVEKNMLPTLPIDSLKEPESRLYSSFCTVVEQPTAQMLEEWSKLTGK
jgi:hypothetical protein